MGGQHRDGPTQDESVRRAFLAGMVLGWAMILLLWAGVAIWDWL